MAKTCHDYIFVNNLLNEELREINNLTTKRNLYQLKEILTKFKGCLKIFYTQLFEILRTQITKFNESQKSTFEDLKEKMENNKITLAFFYKELKDKCNFIASLNRDHYLRVNSMQRTLNKISNDIKHDLSEKLKRPYIPDILEDTSEKPKFRTSVFIDEIFNFREYNKLISLNDKFLFLKDYFAKMKRDIDKVNENKEVPKYIRDKLKNDIDNIFEIAKTDFANFYNYIDTKYEIAIFIENYDEFKKCYRDFMIKLLAQRFKESIINKKLKKSKTYDKPSYVRDLLEDIEDPEVDMFKTRMMRVNPAPIEDRIKIKLDDDIYENLRIQSMRKSKSKQKPDIKYSWINDESDWKRVRKDGKSRRVSRRKKSSIRRNRSKKVASRRKKSIKRSRRI